MRVSGTSVGSTFDDVRRAIARTLDTSTALDDGVAGGRQSTVGGDLDMLGGSTAAAFPGDDDRQLLRELQARRASGENRQRSPPQTSPVAEVSPPPVPQQPQQRVEVRRVRRQISESPATSPDGPDATPASMSTSVGRLNAVEQFRRNEAKRASVISHTSSLVSSDGTINVVTDSEDDDEQRPLATTHGAPATTHTSQLPSPTSKSAATPVSPTRNGILPSPSDGQRVADHDGRESSLSPQRDVISGPGATLLASKCVVSAVRVIGSLWSVHLSLILCFACVHVFISRHGDLEISCPRRPRDWILICMSDVQKRDAMA